MHTLNFFGVSWISSLEHQAVGLLTLVMTPFQHNNPRLLSLALSSLPGFCELPSEGVKRCLFESERVGQAVQGPQKCQHTDLVHDPFVADRVVVAVGLRKLKQALKARVMDCTRPLRSHGFAKGGYMTWPSMVLGLILVSVV